MCIRAGSIFVIMTIGGARHFGTPVARQDCVADANVSLSGTRWRVSPGADWSQMFGVSASGSTAAFDSAPIFGRAMVENVHWIAVLAVVVAAIAAAFLEGRVSIRSRKGTTGTFPGLLAAGVAVSALGGIVGALLAILRRSEPRLGLAVGLVGGSTLWIASALVLRYRRK